MEVKRKEQSNKQSQLTNKNINEKTNKQSIRHARNA